MKRKLICGALFLVVCYFGLIYWGNVIDDNRRKERDEPYRLIHERYELERARMIGGENE